MNKNFDLKVYAEYLQLVGSLSRLFSNSDTPFIQYRTVEILFSKVAGGENIASEDNSFDAVTPDRIPVGVKTFVAGKKSKHKKEKVAEFSHDYIELLKDLDYEKGIKEIVRWRNLRVLSDAKQRALDVNKAIYHCLVRRPGEVFIHEEPYPLINEKKLFPISSSGLELKKFIGFHFSDGDNSYSFSKSKSTLFKKFDFSKGENSQLIPIKILDDPIKALKNLIKYPSQLWIPDNFSNDEEVEFIPGRDYLVLPLYSSTKKNGKIVHSRSGINQWNARGRVRSFGEVYIKIPLWIHKNPMTHGFFPSTDTKFLLKLPNGKCLSAKVCQAGGKALMSDPNVELGQYLFSVIDADDHHKTSHVLFSYDDLLAIDRDSVRIFKDDNLKYRLEFAKVGSFEEFVEAVSVS